ncbi:MAG: trigger factor [Candidatus Paceibacterota bacterium]|jgi:trigger factor
MKTEIKKLEKSEVEISGSLPAESFMEYEKKAILSLGKEIEIDGFRKGHALEDVLKSKISNSVLLDHMAELAISELYPQILEQDKIDAIGRPEITIVKLAKDNPLEFKIKTAVVPEVKLPDYKKLAAKEAGKEKEKIEVTEKEIEDAIMDIRKMRAAHMKIPHTHEHTEGEEEHDHGHEETSETTKDALPEFNLEFVKTLGEFKDIEDFKIRLTDNIKTEKENKAREKRRVAILEAIIDKTNIEVPEILTQAELDKMIMRMEADISAMGMQFEDYMKHLGKTREDLRKDLFPDAEKRAQVELLIHKIADEEKVAPDEEKVASEVAHLMEHYKGADPLRARAYVENMFTNEKVLEFLENQK